MIIKNGTIIDPVSGREYKSDILIENGIIKDIQENIIPDSSETVIDATSLLIGPGLIDTHVHFRDPGFTYKEDIYSGSKAALAGGFSQVVLMANTNPRIDNEEALTYVLNKGRETDLKVHSCANVSMDMAGRELTDMKKLLAAGAVGFTDDGIPLMDPDITKKAMTECAKLEVPISFHEEDPTLISNNGINRGKASAYFGIEGSPKEAEINLITRDIEIAKTLKTEGFLPAIVIQHISTAEGVALVRQAQKEGLNIHAEATPHHFTLTEEAAIKYGTLAKMNPPLRTDKDRLAIIEGLKDGTIDLIATDHAPHSKEEKEKPITEAPSGITGLETSLSLGIESLVLPGHLTYTELFKKMSLNPAKLYGLKGGVIAPDEAADLVIFSPDEVHSYDNFKSKSDNTPFKGMRLKGNIKYTIVNGKIAFEG